MAEIDLKNFGENGLVIRFDGEENGININTYIKFLTAFSRAIKVINRKVDKDCKIEIILTKEKPGCFLVYLKPILKYGKPIAKELWRTLVAPLLVLYIFHKAFPDATIIDFSTNKIVVEFRDKEAITINVSDEQKQFYNAIISDTAVDKNITDAAKAVHSDKFIKGLHIHDGSEDKAPVLNLSSSDLSKIASVERAVETTIAVVSVHKPVFEQSNRKWEFLWDGNIISASISDSNFFERMKERSFSLKQNQKFNATIRMRKEFDVTSESWIVREYKITNLDDCADEEK